jgi:hypothetical protein
LGITLIICVLKSQGLERSVGREADDTAELALGFDRPEARRY